MRKAEYGNYFPENAEFLRNTEIIFQKMRNFYGIRKLFGGNCGKKFRFFFNQKNEKIEFC